MSVHLRDEQRRLLPRWRESEIAANTSEFAALPSEGIRTSPADQTEVEERLQDWRGSPSVGTAADAIAAAFLLGGSERVREPAQFLLANQEQVAGPALELARRIMQPEQMFPLPTGAAVHAPNHRTAIAALRARLITTPRNPIAYVDLARRHAALGQLHRAAESFRAALALAPNNRFVLRSASRFYVHAGDPERAQDVLRRATRIRSDPWLLAAEISAATVAGRESRFVKTGRELAARSHLPPVHLSELAGALGTLEINAGNRRSARRLFKQAMTAPTDNSLAQAQWAAKMLDLDDLPPLDAVPLAFEARALAALRDSSWHEVIEACVDWLDDEPFSHKWAALGSFAAATGLGDHEHAILLAGAGLTANPNDQTLRNNLVYSLASLGRVAEAVKQAQVADTNLMEEDTRIAWTATLGLLNYRLGNSSIGQRHYEAAIAAAELRGKIDMAAVAALNWALVTAYLRDSTASAISKRALGLAEKSPSPSVDALRARLQQLVSKAASARDSARGS